MHTDHNAEKTTASIVAALSSYNLSDNDIQKIKGIIGDSLVGVVNTTTDQHIKSTVRCCGPEADIAHQIQHEANLQKKAIIANLMAPP